ncbi:N-acyl homoserine lactonase family protein [Natrarchaeobius sp. A-rgal3]|uniref:N-acyl homoserine lactonase family protein n=1 Tax=Natrarchaeobius versutus TaxID=1679078 RepID=UPI00350F8A02
MAINQIRSIEGVLCYGNAFTDTLTDNPRIETPMKCEKEPIRIHVLHTGSVYIDRALAFRERSLHPMPYTGWLRSNAKKLWVPVSAYLIDHPDGLVLVDTGWHTDMRKSQRSHLGFLPATMLTGRLPAGEAIHEQLTAMDVEVGDLTDVVLTHLDSDHVSGVEHVKDASNIIVSQPEWEARGDVRYSPSMWDGVDINPFALTDIPFGPYNEGLDLFGDGRVYLVFTPGHSAGQLSVLVHNGIGWILLSSDVGYAERAWADGVLPGVTDNDDEARASLRWVAEFSQRDDCLAVLANHDTDVVPGEV